MQQSNHTQLDRAFQTCFWFLQRVYIQTKKKKLIDFFILFWLNYIIREIIRSIITYDDSTFDSYWDWETCHQQRDFFLESLVTLLKDQDQLWWTRVQLSILNKHLSHLSISLFSFFIFFFCRLLNPVLVVTQFTLNLFTRNLDLSVDFLCIVHPYPLNIYMFVCVCECVF